MIPQNTSPNQISQNFITLTFNGVDFRLVPSSTSSSAPMDDTPCGLSLIPNSGGKFTAIQLNSFTGTLYVCEKSSNNVHTETPETPIPKSSTTTIEDEEGSPINIHKEEKKNKTVSEKGQQQLPFEKKKRVRTVDSNEKKDVIKKTKVSRHQSLLQQSHK